MLKVLNVINYVHKRVENAKSNSVRFLNKKDVSLAVFLHLGFEIRPQACWVVTINVFVRLTLIGNKTGRIPVSRRLTSHVIGRRFRLENYPESLAHWIS
jgi:hypothetical protein